MDNCACRAGRYEVDGYVYNAAEEPKILMTGKWNESMSYQPCDLEGEPLPGTELKEVSSLQCFLFESLGVGLSGKTLGPSVMVPQALRFELWVQTNL